MSSIRRSILLLICLLISCVSLLEAQTKGNAEKVVKTNSQLVKEGKKSARYPNELTGYRFYETAKWKTLEPLVSTIADVRKTLGEPFEANDVNQYTKAYPGDDKASQPVFTYKVNSDWKLLVYFGKYCFRGDTETSDFLNDKLCSIELLPNEPLSFRNVIFPSVFNKIHTDAFQGRWDEYADGTGLIYEVFTGPTAYGKEKAGDLNRIVYTASDETFKKIGRE